MVVGHEAEQLKAALRKRLGLCFAVQEPQLGTGHALLQTEPLLRGARGTLVLLSGDVPLLGAATLARLVGSARGAAGGGDGPDRSRRQPVRLRPNRSRKRAHRRASSSTRTPSPTERAIARDQQRHLRLRPCAALRRAAVRLAPTNAQGEYYLPDLVADLPVARAAGRDGHARRTRARFWA